MFNFSSLVSCDSGKTRTNYWFRGNILYGGVQLASLYKKFLGQIKHWSHDLWGKWILSKLQKHEKLHQQSHSGDKESNFLGTGVLKIA